MADITFRDFAGAIMQGNVAGAASVLETLLGLPSDQATAASEHFGARMTADPAFMQKAMGLRTALTSGSDAEIAALLADCFGLGDTARPTAIATLRSRYPTPA